MDHLQAAQILIVLGVSDNFLDFGLQLRHGFQPVAQHTSVNVLLGQTQILNHESRQLFDGMGDLVLLMAIDNLYRLANLHVLSRLLFQHLLQTPTVLWIGDEKALRGGAERFGHVLRHFDVFLPFLVCQINFRHKGRLAKPKAEDGHAQ